MRIFKNLFLIQAWIKLTELLRIELESFLKKHVCLYVSNVSLHSMFECQLNMILTTNLEKKDKGLFTELFCNIFKFKPEDIKIAIEADVNGIVITFKNYDIFTDNFQKFLTDFKEKCNGHFYGLTDIEKIESQTINGVSCCIKLKTGKPDLIVKIKSIALDFFDFNYPEDLSNTQFKYLDEDSSVQAISFQDINEIVLIGENNANL